MGRRCLAEAVTMINADKLIQCVNAAGFYACRRRVATCVNQSMVICATTADFQYVEDCISFWLVNNRNNWILCCWSYRYWVIPEDVDVVEVVGSYLRSSGSFTHVPSDLVEKYRLEEISDEDPQLILAMRYGVESTETIKDLPEFLVDQLRQFELSVTSKSLREFDIEGHVFGQLQNDKPLFIVIDKDSELLPGLDHIDLQLPSQHCIAAPGVESVWPTADKNVEKSTWPQLILDFAIRYNIIMYFEASLLGKFPVLDPSIDSIKKKFRINDASWRSMSLESKLLIQANEVRHKKRLFEQ